MVSTELSGETNGFECVPRSDLGRIEDAFVGHRHHRVLLDAVLGGGWGRVVRACTGAGPVFAEAPLVDGALIFPADGSTPPDPALLSSVISRGGGVLAAPGPWLDCLGERPELAAITWYGFERRACMPTAAPLPLPDGFALERFRPELTGALVEGVGPLGFGLFGTGDALAEGGMGQCVLRGGRVVSAATTLAVSNACAEISVVTRRSFRRLGLADIACRALLADCAQRGWKASWHAATNTSRRLGFRLGFGTPAPFKVFMRVF